MKSAKTKSWSTVYVVILGMYGPEEVLDDADAKNYRHIRGWMTSGL
jgi:hypothetical protein